MSRIRTGRGAGVRRALALVGATVLVAGGALVVVVPTAVAVAPASVPASALWAAATGAGDATVRGTLVIGTTKAPAPGITVTLNGTSTGTDSLTRTTVSSANGSFAFSGLAGGSSWTYTVTAPYGGVQYSTDIVQVGAGATTTVTLSLYDTTPSPSSISVTGWTVWVDVEGATMAVQQDVELRNSGKASYAGSDPVTGVPGNDHAAVTLPVAAGAAHLEYLGRFEVCCGAVAGETWSHTRPISPGDTTGTLRYEAPFTPTLSFPARFATTSFVLFAPVGTEVSSPQLTRQPGTSSDRGITYQAYKATATTAGGVVTVTLTPPASGTGPWVWIAVASASLLVVGAIAGAFVVRRRRGPSAAPAATDRPGSAPTTGPTRTNGHPTPKAKQPKAKQPHAVAEKGSRAAPVPPRTPTSPSTARGNPQELADELAMLDLAFENGALPDESAIRRVRESLIGRLVLAVGDDPATLEAALEGALERD